MSIQHQHITKNKIPYFLFFLSIINIIQLSYSFMSNPITEILIKKVCRDDELKKIYKLDLSIRNIDKIESLEIVPQLRCLILNYNKIVVIQNLKVLTDLRQLHLQNNLIRRIQGLQACKNLTVLILMANKIEEIQGLGTLTKLQTLNLDHNNIKKLTGIENLKDLKNLSVNSNRIDSLDYIPAFSKLQNISLSNNKISSIQNKFFENSVKLNRLDLSKNQIKNINFLECLPNLQYLNLSSNRITNINLENTFSYMETLDLSDNEISQLPYIPTIFPDLMNLNISNNYLTNEMSLIQAIAGIDYLVDLDFRNNPMYTEQFQKTIHKLHNLDVINGKVINKIGDKYKQKINKITKQIKQFPQLYLADDKFPEEIAGVGLFDSQLQFELTGTKPNRPQSPQRRTKQQKQQSDVDTLDNQRAFFQYIQETNEKINRMRNQYMFIFKKNGIVPQQKVEEPRGLQNQKSSLNLISTKPPEQIIENLKAQNEKNKNKWSELKLKQKGFQIRDLKKKKSINIQSQKNQNSQASLPKVFTKLEKFDLMKTHMNPFNTKIVNEAHMAKTFHKGDRPNSLKK